MATQNFKFDCIYDVMDYFRDQETCKKFLEAVRWENNNVVCPHCKHNNAYRTKVGFKCSNKECYKKFNVLTKTIFEGTKIPLRKWFVAMFMLMNDCSGISSVTFAKTHKVTQHTAWFLLHRLREVMKKAKSTGKLSGIIEADETIFGGRESNKPKSKRAKKGKGCALVGKTKTYIIGAVQENGDIVTTLSDFRGKDVLIPFLNSNVEKGSTIVTDNLSGYKDLPLYDYTHYANKHSKHKFVRYEGDAKYHTQTIEGFWSLFKGAVKGTHKYISLKHLSKYTAEHTTRYNQRKKDPSSRFMNLIGMVGNTTIRYRDMIAGSYRTLSIAQPNTKNLPMINLSI